MHRIVLAGTLSTLFLVACVAGDSKAKPDAGPSPCDGTTSCSECSNCADQSTCADEKHNCSVDSACVGINECLPLCGGNLQCETDCYNSNAAGAAHYDAWRKCVICDACPSDCEGFEDCS